ncbi:MAG: GWxTD domain-containing protein [Candidatus Polarisedimenticolia bacterium]
MVRRFVSLLALVLLSIPPVAAQPEDYRKPDKDWVKGPVRWILSDAEEKEFKKLSTDEQRAAYVKSFWEARDPTPGTPLNEFEALFWHKVKEAEKAFTTTDPGSLTDRGRVYLLLGPPSDTGKDTRGRILWTYEPGPTNGITEKIQLSFVAPTPFTIQLLDRKLLETYVRAHPATRGIGWKIPQAPEEVLVPAAGAGEEAAEPETPETIRQVAALEAVLAKGSGPTAVPFQAAWDFYATADGTTLTVLTLEAPREAGHGSGDEALRPFARLVPDASGDQPVNVVGDQPFVPAADAPAGSFIYQARRNLKPGSYRVALIVEDRVIQGASGALVQTLRVPDFRERSFTLSSVALLGAFRQAAADLGPDDAPRAGPYVLGSFRIVPRAVPVLQRTDTLALYYQVYNPTPDPGTSRPNLEVTYSFFIRDAGTWKPYRKPIVKNQRGQVELYAIDLKDLLLPNQPLPADFRMEARLLDIPGGKDVKRELLFSVR